MASDKHKGQKKHAQSENYTGELSDLESFNRSKLSSPTLLGNQVLRLFFIFLRSVPQKNFFSKHVSIHACVCVSS